MPFLQPDHRPSIKHPSGHPVEVITTTNPEGKMRVDYFRIEDDRSERFTYKMHSSFIRKEENYIMTFDCAYDAHGLRNSIVLIFDVTKCHWMVE
ncbi:MAG: hypothetical protein K0R34_2879 [Herbinix sp.]|jgi:uncharacterized protein YvpB|nr:hypothetical protein [Herbinix sp.]